MTLNGLKCIEGFPNSSQIVHLGLYENLIYEGSPNEHIKCTHKLDSWFISYFVQLYLSFNFKLLSESESPFLPKGEF